MRSTLKESNLYKEDLQKRKWLTDDTACPETVESSVPSHQWPAENDGFHTEQHEALQIHFVAGNHWVASSSFEHQVTVYDSKYSSKFHPSLTHQLACIYRSLRTIYDDGSSMLDVEVPNMQQQFGSSDCGLFAIVFAVHLAFKDDPRHILFE